MKASKREPANLPKKLAEAFLGADPAVREAIRKNPAYQSIVGKWANQVGEALNGPRTTIHPGDQGMRELFRLATALPPDLAQDLVVAATPAFVNCSNAVAEHNKGDGAIFSSKAGCPFRSRAPTLKRQSRALTGKHRSRRLTLRLQIRIRTMKLQSQPISAI